ncbi:MAG: aspartate ammonia-lyase, partial [Bacteroidota bacterium]
MRTRTEKDNLGEKEIPENVYWGIHTAHALDNFKLTGYPVPLRLIQALATVKKACCETNSELGYINKTTAVAINR